jgi:hypothetical protein
MARRRLGGSTLVNLPYLVRREVFVVDFPYERKQKMETRKRRRCEECKGPVAGYRRMSVRIIEDDFTRP